MRMLAFSAARFTPYIRAKTLPFSQLLCNILFSTVHIGRKIQIMFVRILAKTIKLVKILKL